MDSIIYKTEYLQIKRTHYSEINNENLLNFLGIDIDTFSKYNRQMQESCIRDYIEEVLNDELENTEEDVLDVYDIEYSIEDSL